MATFDRIDPFTGGGRLPLCCGLAEETPTPPWCAAQAAFPAWSALSANRASQTLAARRRHRRFAHPGVHRDRHRRDRRDRRLVRF